MPNSYPDSTHTRHRNTTLCAVSVFALPCGSNLFSPHKTHLFPIKIQLKWQDMSYWTSLCAQEHCQGKTGKMDKKGFVQFCALKVCACDGPMSTNSWPYN